MNYTKNALLILLVFIFSNNPVYSNNENIKQKVCTVLGLAALTNHKQVINTFGKPLATTTITHEFSKLVSYQYKGGYIGLVYSLTDGSDYSRRTAPRHSYTVLSYSKAFHPKSAAQLFKMNKSKAQKILGGYIENGQCNKKLKNAQDYNSVINILSNFKSKQLQKVWLEYDYEGEGSDDQSCAEIKSTIVKNKSSLMAIQAGKVTPGIYAGDATLFIDSLIINGERNGLIYEMRNKSHCDEFGEITVTPFAITSIKNNVLTIKKYPFDSLGKIKYRWTLAKRGDRLVSEKIYPDGKKTLSVFKEAVSKKTYTTFTPESKNSQVNKICSLLKHFSGTSKSKLEKLLGTMKVTGSENIILDGKKYDPGKITLRDSNNSINFEAQNRNRILYPTAITGAHGYVKIGTHGKRDIKSILKIYGKPDSKSSEYNEPGGVTISRYIYHCHSKPKASILIIFHGKKFESYDISLTP